MTERMVKFRLITYFEEVDDPANPDGGKVLREHVASIGQVVDIPRAIDEQRLDSLGALYTAEEREAIDDGSYRGADANILRAARAGIRPQLITPAEGESPSGVDIRSMDVDDLADHIRDSKLTVSDTLALLPEDASEDDITKLYDAETQATDNEPRKGVTDKLDAELARVAQG